MSIWFLGVGRKIAWKNVFTSVASVLVLSINEYIPIVSNHHLKTLLVLAAIVLNLCMRPTKPIQGAGPAKVRRVRIKPKEKSIENE